MLKPRALRLPLQRAHPEARSREIRARGVPCWSMPQRISPIQTRNTSWAGFIATATAWRKTLKWRPAGSRRRPPKVSRAHKPPLELCWSKAGGLSWLTLANKAAGPKEPWIKEAYAKTVARASESDVKVAHAYADSWLRDHP